MPKTPEILAEILGYILGLIELHVIADVADQYRASGRPVFPNALLVNKSNPINIEVSGTKGNILEEFFPIDEDQFDSKEYLDVECEGIIYRPKDLDRVRELERLRRELANCQQRRDASRIAWLEKNIKSVPDGAFYRRRYNGGIGNKVDFAFTEEFFEGVSDHVGYFSHLGEHKIHWSIYLDDFGEKGVDCDLIMQVMDDLHQNEVDVFVLMTNDMDFLPLVERIIKDGKRVFLCGLWHDVSRRLTETVPRNAFFDLGADEISRNLATVFLTQDRREVRRTVLQWAWLCLLREAGSGSRDRRR